MQINGHTLTDIEISTTANGGRVFLATLIGRRGKALAGYVCGRVEEDGTFADVRHVNGANQRRLS